LTARDARSNNLLNAFEILVVEEFTAATALVATPWRVW